MLTIAIRIVWRCSSKTTQSKHYSFDYYIAIDLVILGCWYSCSTYRYWHWLVVGMYQHSNIHNLIRFMIRFLATWRRTVGDRRGITWIDHVNFTVANIILKIDNGFNVSPEMVCAYDSMAAQQVNFEFLCNYDWFRLFVAYIIESRVCFSKSFVFLFKIEILSFFSIARLTHLSGPLEQVLKFLYFRLYLWEAMYSFCFFNL